MKKFYRIITLVLISCIVFITGYYVGISVKLTNTIKTLKFENIKSARIELTGMGGGPIKNYVFDANNPDQIKIIRDVISSLNSGKVQGSADEKITNKGGSPPFLILEPKDGSVIRIKAAVGGKVTKFADGSTERSQFDIPNQITISRNSNEKPIRILSPEIRKLIDGGYKNTFKLNSAY